MSKVFAQVFRLAYAADPLFWIFKTPTPTAFCAPWNGGSEVAALHCRVRQEIRRRLEAACSPRPVR